MAKSEHPARVGQLVVFMHGVVAQAARVDERGIVTAVRDIDTGAVREITIDMTRFVITKNFDTRRAVAFLKKNGSHFKDWKSARGTLAQFQKAKKS